MSSDKAWNGKARGLELRFIRGKATGLSAEGNQGFGYSRLGTLICQKRNQLVSDLAFLMFALFFRVGYFKPVPCL